MRGGAILPAALLVLAAAPASIPIYSDGLQPGWDDQSWAHTETVAGFGSDRAMRPLKVEAGSWAAVSFHANRLDLAGRRTVTLFVNGGAGGGQHLAVVPVVDGKGRVEQGYGFTVPAGGRWMKVVAPLPPATGAAGRLEGLWIQNRSSDPAPTFYLEDVSIA